MMINNLRMYIHRYIFGEYTHRPVIYAKLAPRSSFVSLCRRKSPARVNERSGICVSGFVDLILTPPPSLLQPQMGWDWQIQTYVCTHMRTLFVIYTLIQFSSSLSSCVLCLGGCEAIFRCLIDYTFNMNKHTHTHIAPSIATL